MFSILVMPLSSQFKLIHSGPSSIEQYLTDVIRISRVMLKDNLVSIILFGSAARNEVSITSDVDILLVVHKYDRTTIRLEKIIRSLSLKYGLIFIPRGFFGKLFYALSQATGMFRPVFIADETSVKNWKFFRIFKVSRLMSRILAPKNAVKYTISRSYKLLYGKDIIKQLHVDPPSLGDVIKSFLMNLILAVCSVVLIPLHRETYKFVYEAVKWSLFNYAYASQIAPNIMELSGKFKNPIRRGMYHFLYTRNNGKLSPGLLLYSIPAILKIHIASIKQIKSNRKTRNF